MILLFNTEDISKKSFTFSSVVANSIQFYGNSYYSTHNTVLLKI